MKSVSLTASIIAGLSASHVEAGKPPLPLSDPDNREDWVINYDVSDEFEDETLDEDKWFVQGTDGKFDKWKGRAPSQYVPHSVSVKDGMLRITTRWEPDYEFASEPFDGRSYENITTGAIISHASFLHGYMEIRSKAAAGAVTSAFWALGHQSELDVFEQMGGPKIPKDSSFGKDFMFSIHDWRPGVVPGQNRVFNHKHRLPFNVADDFHVYGCEWDVDSLKFFVDGDLVHTVTQKELDDAWILTNPLQVWLDSEVFPWLGLPTAEELPVDFIVDYVRIWQKPEPNLLDRAFHGFEGPLLMQPVRVPGDQKPHQKEWFIPDEAKAHLTITGEKHFNGRKSLKFVHDGALKTKEATAMAPNGSAKLEAGGHILRFRVWLERDNAIKKLHPILDEPWLQIPPIDLSQLPTRQWVEIVQPFSRDSASGPKDRLRFTFQAADIVDGDRSTVLIDDVSIEKAK